MSEIKQQLLKELKDVQKQVEAGQEDNLIVTYLNLLNSYLALFKKFDKRLTAEQVVTKTLVEALVQINLSPLTKEEWLTFNEYLMRLSSTILQAALSEVKREKGEA